MMNRHSWMFVMLRYIFSAPFPITLHVGHVFSRAVTDTEHQSQITFCAAVTYYHETEAEYSAFQTIVRSSQVFKNIFQ